MTECPICNKEFKQLHGSHIKKHNMTTQEFKTQFPQISLRNEAGYEKRQAKIAKELENNPINCLHCNKLITSVYRKRMKFCNSSCAAYFNNKLRTHVANNIQHPISSGCMKISTRLGTHKSCIYCNKEFVDKSHNNQRKCCSVVCNNKLKGVNAAKSNATLLQQGALIQRQSIKKAMSYLGIEYCCSICKITIWNNKPISLTLDHIDGKANNNRLDNLRLICPNCDSQSDHYKGRNKGNGRKSLGLIK